MTVVEEAESYLFQIDCDLTNLIGKELADEFFSLEVAPRYWVRHPLWESLTDKQKRVVLNWLGRRFQAEEQLIDLHASCW